MYIKKLVRYSFFCLNRLLSLIPYPKKKVLLKVDYVASDLGNCGIACVAMIVRDVSVNELINSYKKEPFYKDPIGWYHNGLVHILAQNGHRAKALRFQTVVQLRNYLSNGQPVVVSLKVPFPDNIDANVVYKAIDRKKELTGHLCVLTGFDQQGFYLHDPRNIRNYSKNVYVPYGRFAEIFNGSGILIYQ